MTGPELQQARNQLRLTQSGLASLLNVTRRTVARYERARCVPKSVQWALLEISHSLRNNSDEALASPAKPC